ncbi:pleckstrin homology domain-containing family S member 1-like isoform X1 [Triplophysa rosa]|uniref:pleckstrin homology domain-containing family S member 1-like isoform X1 n=1 Tax=Triplophysa rosa TaxID=992332 RepID=UPI002545DB27|nr:pleckstrin homology domain-containing family S member 1-like isoform X1 [Triplophysa rosa]
MPNKNKPKDEKISSEPPMGEELYTGYLHKSPFLSTFSKGMKSWKRRFFVLSKTGEDTYHLAYFRNDEKKGKSVGEIDLSKVSLICTCPEKHQMWDWIQENFKCSSASVLFLRVEDFMPKSARDYFLIGENSEEVNGWLNELLKVLNTQTSENKVQVTNDSLQQENRYRSISAPTPNSQDCDEELSHTEQHLSDQSESRCIFTSQPLGDIPRKLSDITLSDDDTDDLEEEPETPEDNSDYMRMGSVLMVLKQEEDACLQTNETIDVVESSQDLCDAAGNQDQDTSMQRNSAELRCSKDSLSEMNGNCVSTEMNKGLLKKSETPTLVEKEISITRNDLDTSLIFTEEQGKLCVSECKQTERSHLFHKGDQILAFNDLLIDSVEEIQIFTRRLSKDEAKLTVLRQPGSQPFHDESFLSHS